MALNITHTPTSSKNVGKRLMTWTGKHDVLLCREILLVEPFAHKEGSRERGNAWDVISSELNCIEDGGVNFEVTKRAVRDRYNLILNGWKQKERENHLASGTVVEESELDILLREIHEKSSEAAKVYNNTDNNKKKAEREKAEDIRNLAMETLGETQKRKSLNQNSPDNPQKKRRTSTETLDYLRERSEQEFQLRRQELQQKTEETALLRQLVLQNSQMVQAMLQKNEK